ncbi:hypothetical protein PF004_g6773 [Phytophthora fragariae]|uniref:PHD-type domain-containing protein n=1 Tax=Phytophthora fragariae TaxID=53985 RepID=A0A6G0PBN7_9STRA|nr:hypothetical protein PF004_g6773 [Phytophthora fragariae]
MLSVPLMLLRVGDAAEAAQVREPVGPKPTGEWLGRFLAGFGAQLAARGDYQTLQIEDGHYTAASMERSEGDSRRQERPASSPCPSSSSSSSSSSSDSSSSSSDSEDETPPPPANGGSGGRGNGGDDQKKKKKEDDDEKEEKDGDGDSSDSSSSDSSAESEDEEEDDGVLIDTDDEKDKVHNGVDPTDEDVSGESDGSSDLENSYPRLPTAPVDTLIAFRQQAAQKELQLTERLKKEVVADARQRQQDRREQAQRSKKNKKAPQPKRRHSKQSDSLSNGSTHLERGRTNGSTGTADVKMASKELEDAEDEWMVDCSCGLKEKNYDDGTSMIQCDSCSHWVHAKCADKQPEAVEQEKFLCFRCGWMFDCVCSVRRMPNHDDGQRMVECESCKTWQHTMCVGIPMTEEPPDDYRCPRCVKNTRRRKSSSEKGSGSRERQRKRSHTESSRHHRKSSDASPVVAVDVRSSARSIDTLTTPIRAHRSRRAEANASPKVERKAPHAQVSSPPPVPAVSPPSSPPPPPSTPPPPSVVSRSSRHDRSHGHPKRRNERERERSSASGSSSHRDRGRPRGSSPSTKTRSRAASSEMERHAPPPAAVTPSPRGKGLMLRGYSPASVRSETPSSHAVDVRPPLPLTPQSAGACSGHSYSSHGSHNSHDRSGRKRKTGSARDRLAKKLKIKKSSLR